MKTIDPPHDAGDHVGLTRVVVSRMSSGWCSFCGRTFTTLAGAVSHGRANKHPVMAEYAARYSYTPREQESDQ